MLGRLSYTTVVGLLLATALATAQAPTLSQTAPTQPIPPVTFKVEINYVEVNARVLDQQGSFIRDLKRDDFQIMEDGKPQTVSTFALVDIPVVPVEKPLFAAQPIEPDVASNVATPDGRLYVLVLDDYHTSFLRTQRVKEVARRFILEKLGAGDLAAVVVTSGRRDCSQDFTPNRRLLLDAVDKFMGQKLPSATAARADIVNRSTPDPMRNDQTDTSTETGDLYDPRKDPVEDPDEVQRSYQARAAMSTLRGVAEWMASVRGRRKALVFISEGIDYNVQDVFYANNPSVFEFNRGDLIMDEARETIAAASRSNISIYAVDPRGLTTMGQEDIEIAAYPSEAYRIGPRSLALELQNSQDSLRTLADGTGGFAAVNQNDLKGAFDRIVEENSSYYVLGYYSTNQKRDGKFRNLDVRVNRKGVQVHARKGYGAPYGEDKAERNATAKKKSSPGADEMLPQLMEMLGSPLPLSGLTMNVTATAFKGTAPNASVAVLVEARGTDLKFTEKNGTFNGKLSLAVAAFDKTGKMTTGERPEVGLTLKPDTHKRVMQYGVRFLTRLQLPPGRYQVRVAANEAVSTGSVHYDLEVPDFSKERLVMSGLVLSSRTGDAALTLGADASFGGALPAPPTALRDFPVNDELALYAEVYDNVLKPPHQVDITSTIRTDVGREVYRASEARASGELGGSKGGFGYTARIPLKGLPPGLYVLTVEAGSRLGNDEPESRVVQFRIH
jgi:VWFA-related protein